MAASTLIAVQRSAVTVGRLVAAPARRARSDRPARQRRRRARSTSAAVEVWPRREPQRRPRAARSSAPIASSTWRGLGDPGRAGRPGRALDAGRVEQEQQRVALAAGEGEVRVAGQPVDRVAVEDRVRAPRPAPGRPARRAAPPTRAANSGWPFDRHLDRDREARRSPATSSVPERTSRSWPPPCSSGVHGDVAAEQQRADADRAAELVPGQRSARRRRTRRSRPAPGRPPAPRRCATGCRRSAAIAASSPTGCTVPTSLFAHITVTSATVVGVAPSSSSRSASRSTRPCASTGSQLTSAPSCPAQPVDRVEHGVVLDRGWRGPGVRRRVGRPARPEEALDREVVALGAAAGEDHLGRAGRPAPRRPARGTPRRPGGRAGPAACSDEALPTSRAAADVASTASASIGVVAAWSRYAIDSKRSPVAGAHGRDRRPSTPRSEPDREPLTLRSQPLTVTIMAHRSHRRPARVGGSEGPAFRPVAAADTTVDS